MRSRAAISIERFLASFAMLALVAACGGGGSGDAPDAGAPPTAPPVTPPTTPPESPVAAPTAAFTAAATGTVQAPIAFDASTSKAADNSALQYMWDFGDGVRGGGAKIAHAFAAAGSRSVTLTVIDAGGRQGKVTRGVEVTAAAAAVGTLLVHAAIVDSTGAALPGVAIGVPGSATPLGTTDSTGVADITLDRVPMLVLRLTKAGYADQMQVIQLPTTSSGTGTRITVVMSARDAAQTLAGAHVGGSFFGRAGATITLPADALVNAAGVVVTGAVPISMTTVDPTLKGGGGFPGRFDGVTPDGATTPIVSFGTVEFVLGEASNRLQLAPGKTATIELPVMANRKLDGSAVAVGDVIPLWSLDETTGVWIQEGTGTIVANAGAASGLAMRAVVSHFSWWNTDLGFDPYGPDPYCEPQFPEESTGYDEAGNCYLTFEIDSGAGAATPSNFRMAGYSRSVTLPVAGGVTIPVPANNDVTVTAFAMNGTWTGQRVINGAIGVRQRLSIPMRPVSAGPAPMTEALTLPFTNLTRTVAAGQASARFSFPVGALQPVHLRVGPPAGATQRGTVRVLAGATVLATNSFNNSTIDLQVRSPASGTYVLEVTPELPGAFVISGELAGDVLTENVNVPSTVTRSVVASGTYNAVFDLAATTSVHLAAKPDVAIAKGELRLAGSDGTILWSRSGVGNVNAEQAELSLPAGRYTFTYTRTDVAPSTLQFQLEAIDWLPVADAIMVADTNAVTELVADRNGRPVVGVLTHPVINQVGSSQIQLRRFTGAGWENVGGPIASSEANCGNDTASVAFDSTNTPTIAFARHTLAGVDSTSVLQLVGGVWQAVGPNGGVLPASSYACEDGLSPRLVIDSADRPIVAYKGNAAVVVRRFDGTAWSKLAVSAQDAFPVNSSAHDLAIDPAGTVWFALRGGDSGDTTTVRRFDVPSGLWQTVGPNGGVLPETTTQSLDRLRVAFDAGGRPVIGAAASVFSPDRTSTSGGTVVYRFDGANWLTTGGYQLPASMINNSVMPGFAVLGSDVLMSWTNSYSSRQIGVVQRNTPSGWSACGIGPDGQPAAYVAHGPTPNRLISDSRVLVVGSDVYMAINVPVLSSTVFFNPTNPSFNATYGIVLLKKTP
ncbi:hypothetical protein BH10PSE17_BH10PSE17_12510 [soil metagenome]